MRPRKIIKKLHLYIALVLCLPLVIQGLTGAIMVFQHEISDHFAFKNHIFVEGENHKISEIISAAQTQVPEGFKANSIKIDEAATLRFFKKTADKNEMLEVAIDPVSLEVLQIKNSETDFFRIIKRFHASLLIKGETGKNIVGIYGFVMLFMTISGIIIWWPKAGNWKRAFTFKFSSTGKKFNRDLHGAVGFWVSIFLLITSFSGVYLVYPKGTAAFISSIFPARDLRETPKITAEGKAISIDEVIATAAEDKKLISVMIPGKPDQPYRLSFAPENYRDGAPLIVVFVDQYRKEIIEKRDPQNYSIGETITIWQHSLHEGQGFSVIYQIIVFFLGFSILLFSITGVLLWWIKKRERKLRLQA